MALLEAEFFSVVECGMYIVEVRRPAALELWPSLGSGAVTASSRSTNFRCLRCGYGGSEVLSTQLCRALAISILLSYSYNTSYLHLPFLYVEMPVENFRAKKLCFVTIGATASFDALIKEALSGPFLDALRDAGFSDLLLQHGKEGGKILEDFKRKNTTESERVGGLNIKGFDFNKAGLGQEMRAAKGENGTVEGVVISHAGNLNVLPFAPVGGSRTSRLGLDSRRSQDCGPLDRGP